MKQTFYKQTTTLLLSILFSLLTQAQTVYTSTGTTGNWNSPGRWSVSGSGGTITYVIQSGHTVNITGSISGIDSILVYGNLTVSNNINIDLNASGLIYLSGSSSLTGGNGNTEIKFGGSGTIKANSGLNESGERYATSSTNGFTSGNPLPVRWLQVQAFVEGARAAIEW